MISGAVLAGGKGSRMGVDKASLLVGGRPLLDRALDALEHVADDILVVGRPELSSPGGIRDVPDLRPGWGALGGIFTALTHAKHERCLVVACDMPFLNWRLLSYLASFDPSYDVVVPRLGSWLEPLHAVYARACLGPIEALMAAGNRRIFDFFPAVRVRYVDATEMSDFGSLDLAFLNVNTPSELERALALVEGQAEAQPC